MLGGVGALMLPGECAWGGGRGCAAPPHAPSDGAMHVGTTAPAKAVMAAEAVTPVVSAPKPAAPNLVSATFNKLQASNPVPPMALAITRSPQQAVKADTPLVASTPPAPLATRVVKTIPIAGDSALADPPLQAPPATAAAVSAPAPVVPAPKPRPKPAPAADPPAKPAARASMKVTGRGVTVRAGPATAQKALFNLAPGSSVSVSGDHRGWLHITDAKGRTGWAYQRYFAKG